MDCEEQINEFPHLVLTQELTLLESIKSIVRISNGDPNLICDAIDKMKSELSKGI